MSWPFPSRRVPCTHRSDGSWRPRTRRFSCPPPPSSSRSTPCRCAAPASEQGPRVDGAGDVWDSATLEISNGTQPCHRRPGTWQYVRPIKCGLRMSVAAGDVAGFKIPPPLLEPKGFAFAVLLMRVDREQECGAGGGEN